MDPESQKIKKSATVLERSSRFEAKDGKYRFMFDLPSKDPSMDRFLSPFRWRQISSG